MPTRLESWTKAEVAVFLRCGYKTIGWSGRCRETIADAIDHLSGVAMENIGKTRISRPHGEFLHSILSRYCSTLR